jgi:hypothetical protein
MRRSNTTPVSQVLHDFLKNNNLDKKMREARIINSWPDVVGTTVANYTQNLVIKNGVLFVYMKSAVARNELMMIREGLARALNNVVDEDVIREIVIR